MTGFKVIKTRPTERQYLETDAAGSGLFVLQGYTGNQGDGTSARLVGKF